MLFQIIMLLWEFFRLIRLADQHTWSDWLKWPVRITIELIYCIGPIWFMGSIYRSGLVQCKGLMYRIELIYHTRFIFLDLLASFPWIIFVCHRAVMWADLNAWTPMPTCNKDTWPVYTVPSESYNGHVTCSHTRIRDPSTQSHQDNSMVTWLVHTVASG